MIRLITVWADIISASSGPTRWAHWRPREVDMIQYERTRTFWLALPIRKPLSGKQPWIAKLKTAIRLIKHKLINLGARKRKPLSQNVFIN